MNGEQTDIAVIKTQLATNHKLTEEIHGAIFGNGTMGLKAIVATHSLAIKIIGLVTLAMFSVVSTAVANHFFNFL